MSWRWHYPVYSKGDLHSLLYSSKKLQINIDEYKLPPIDEECYANRGGMYGGNNSDFLANCNNKSFLHYASCYVIKRVVEREMEQVQNKSFEAVMPDSQLDTIISTLYNNDGELRLKPMATSIIECIENEKELLDFSYTKQKRFPQLVRKALVDIFSQLKDIPNYCRRKEELGTIIDRNDIVDRIFLEIVGADNVSHSSRIVSMNAIIAEIQKILDHNRSINSFCESVEKKKAANIKAQEKAAEKAKSKTRTKTKDTSKKSQIINTKQIVTKKATPTIKTKVVTQQVPATNTSINNIVNDKNRQEYLRSLLGNDYDTFSNTMNVLNDINEKQEEPVQNKQNYSRQQVNNNQNIICVNNMNSSVNTSQQQQQQQQPINTSQKTTRRRSTKSTMNVTNSTSITTPISITSNNAILNTSLPIPSPRPIAIQSSSSSDSLYIPQLNPTISTTNIVSTSTQAPVTRGRTKKSVQLSSNSSTMIFTNNISSNGATNSNEISSMSTRSRSKRTSIETPVSNQILNNMNSLPLQSMNSNNNNVIINQATNQVYNGVQQNQDNIQTQQPEVTKRRYSTRTRKSNSSVTETIPTKSITPKKTIQEQSSIPSIEEKPNQYELRTRKTRSSTSNINNAFFEQSDNSIVSDDDNDSDYK